MAEIRHLAKAPIVEALIDLRVKLPSSFEPGKLLDLKGCLNEAFPKIEERQQLEHKFGLLHGKPIPPQTELKGLQGLLFRSEDGLDVVQCRIDGFTYSRLTPYLDWETLRDRARKYWKIYCETVAPESVIRIAVRYINRIQPPVPFTDYSNYFTTSLPVPSGRSRVVHGFLTRVLIEDPERQLSAIVIQNLEPSIDPNPVSIILDIDVFKTQEYGMDDEGIWSILEVLHNVKNELFFDSITEEAVRLFE